MLRNLIIKISLKNKKYFIFYYWLKFFIKFLLFIVFILKLFGISTISEIKNIFFISRNYFNYIVYIACSSVIVFQLLNLYLLHKFSKNKILKNKIHFIFHYISGVLPDFFNKLVKRI